LRNSATIPPPLPTIETHGHIYLHNLRVDTVIGVWEWERRIRQTLILDLDIGTNFRQAGHSDDIADTIDYKAVCDRVTSYTQGAECRLIEALGDRLARILFDEFAISWLRLRILKQGVLRNVRDVGIVIERSREA